MLVKENAKNVLEAFVNKESLIRVVEAAKIGVEKDNLVITTSMLQNVMNMLFLELPKMVNLEDSDFQEMDQKADSIKKFMKGEDKRFAVGLDLACNYILKKKRVFFKIQALCINENANAIKFFDDRDLEYVPADEIKSDYNYFIDELNKVFDTDLLDSIKL